MSTDDITLFLDTNCLLHYPPMADTDWLKFCNAASVRLVMCMQVIHELDDKKSHPQLSKRAERSINEIRTFASGGDLRGGVTLTAFHHEPRFEDFPESLSPDSKDDRIIYLVQLYATEHPDERVAVVSEDLGMTLKCSTLGIEVFEPDKTKRLPSPEDSLQRKHRETVAELSQLKNRLPGIQLVMTKPDEEADADSKEPFRAELSKTVHPVDADVAVDEERQRLQGHLWMASEAHRSKVKDYLHEYWDWTIKSNEQLPLRARMLEFSVHVSNVGQGPATDVDVYLTFPARFRFMAGDDESRGHIPPFPKQPMPPSPGDALGLGSLRWDFLTPQFNMPKITLRGTPWTEIKGDEATGFCVRLFIPKLNQHAPPIPFGPFWTVFRTWEDVSPFQVDAAITAKELPKRKEVTIPFLINVVD